MSNVWKKLEKQGWEEVRLWVERNHEAMNRRYPDDQPDGFKSEEADAVKDQGGSA